MDDMGPKHSEMSGSPTQTAIEHLRVLELAPTADLRQVKQGYRILAKVWHPDRFSSDEALQRVAQEKLKAINAAYEWLVAHGDLLPVQPEGDGAPRSSTFGERPGRGGGTGGGPPRPPGRAGAAKGAPSPVRHRREEATGAGWGLALVVGVAGLLLLAVATSFDAGNRDGASSIAQPPQRAAPEVVLSVPLEFELGELEEVGGEAALVLPSPGLTAEAPGAVADAGAGASERAAGGLDLASLSSEERASIEAACSQAKYLEGPAAYRACQESQLRTLERGVRRPDLSALSSQERSSIESACSQDKYLNGPAAYNRCLSSQLDRLRAGTRRPDLSGLSREERTSIESSCSEAKYLRGPAAYNECLASQLRRMEGGPGRPDLSRLMRDERTSIESVCSQAKYLEGPAAYNRCLHGQLRALGIDP